MQARYVMAKNLLPALLVMIVAGCDGEQEWQEYQGYAEGEYIYIAPLEDGLLQTLSVRRGDMIAAGDALFEMDASARRATRDAAAGRVQEARFRLADLQKGMRSEEIEVLVAGRARVRAALELSQQQLQRAQELVEKGVSSQERLDQARAAHDRDRTTIAEFNAEIAAARLAARDDAVMASAAAVGVAEAELAEAQWYLDQRQAKAPKAGLVQETPFDPGEFVPTGAAVVSLLPADHIKVRFFVPQGDLGAISVGQSIRLECDGCPQPILAKISFIAAQAEFTPPVIYSEKSRQKMVYLVEAWPDEAGYTLHPGQPVDVFLKLAGRGAGP